MHRRADGRVEAMLDVVEPLLAGKHVANAHKAHGVVWLGEILVDRGHAGANDQGDRCDRPAEKPDPIAVLVALKVHAACWSPKSAAT
jgi:hypothetical protein